MNANTSNSPPVVTIRTKIRNILPLAVIVTVTAGGGAPCRSQTPLHLQTFFQANIGLSKQQIASINSGQAVSKVLPSRTPKELFLFGAVYVHSAPEKYIELARDYEKRRTLSGFLALGVLGDPPRFPDFNGFSFDADDIKALKTCELGNCPIQLPASAIKDFQEAIDWTAPDVNEQVNRLLQKNALEGVLAYQREGNAVLGVYNDKHSPTEVPRQFAYMLSYYTVFPEPERLPDFYNYLLAYPDGKPANVEDSFYWAKVKFGLKPTLRIVHVMSMRADNASGIACAVAEKQLYSSHYFETALDLTFCVDAKSPKQPGFYLIKVMGSEQAGLTGVKGSMVRSVAVDRSVSSLQRSLMAIKRTLEEQ
jgi:hypothetical protein